MFLAGAALVPGLGLAENLSYNYVEAGYLQVDPDNSNNELDGWALRGSLAITDMWHLIADFNTLDPDFGGSFDSYRVGAGLNYGINATVDLVGRASWVRLDGAGDADGYGLQALVRSQVAPGFELEGGVDFVDFGGSNGDTTSFIAAGRYFFTPVFAAGLSLGINDDAKTYGAEFRFNFK
jgi:hypothetical protein